VSKKKKEAVIY